MEKIIQIFKDLKIYSHINPENPKAAPYRIQAYDSALNQLFSGVDPENLDVGKKLKDKIEEILKTGTLKEWETLTRNPLFKLYKKIIAIPGFGEKTTLKFIKEGVKNLTDLKKKDNLTTAQKLGLKYRKKLSERIERNIATNFAAMIKKILKKTELEKKHPYELIVVGSYRRGSKTLGDIDIIIFTKWQGIQTIINKIAETLKGFKGYIAKGNKKISFIYQPPNKQEITQIDIRFFEPKNKPAAMLYFTGSAATNIKMRQKASKLGLKLNEYGLYNTITGKEIKVKSEEDIFKKIKMDYIPPEER